jgi:hypothetical protein
VLKLLRFLLAPWEDEVGKGIFFTESREARLARLRTEDPEVARELLDEARRLNAGVDAMVEGVERRATTLQGVVSIAATVAVAGGALLLDPAKVQGLGWRLVFAGLFGCLLYCFIATAYRATQSSTEIKVWTLENPEDHLQRASRPPLEVDTETSADILFGYGRNMEVFRWKVTYLRAASEWFLRGLIFLALIAVTFCAYVGFHGQEPTGDASPHPLIQVEIDAVSGSSPDRSSGADSGPDSQRPDIRRFGTPKEGEEAVGNRTP